MDISEVRVKLIQNPTDRLKAFCSVTFDEDFVVRDIKIIEGTTGIFVAMPSRKLTDHCPKCNSKNHLRARHCNECGGSLPPERVRRDDAGRRKLHADIAHPINSPCRQTLQERVVEAFQAELQASEKPDYKPQFDEDYEDRFEEPEPESNSDSDSDSEFDVVEDSLDGVTGFKSNAFEETDEIEESDDFDNAEAEEKTVESSDEYGQMIADLKRDAEARRGSDGGGGGGRRGANHRDAGKPRLGEEQRPAEPDTRDQRDTRGDRTGTERGRKPRDSKPRPEPRAESKPDRKPEPKPEPRRQPEPPRELVTTPVQAQDSNEETAFGIGIDEPVKRKSTREAAPPAPPVKTPPAEPVKTESHGFDDDDDFGAGLA